MQLIVLGMHRSGTSVLARILNLMGAYFGPEGVGTGANDENPKGFWERRDVRALNDHVLHRMGCDWNRVASFDVDAVPAGLAEEFREAASRLVLQMDAHRPWFIKEPRLCLLLPLWLQVLEAPVCVHIHRHPAEVAGSLAKRNGMPLPVGLALWEKYVTAAAGAAAGLPSVGVLHHRLLTDPVGETERLHSRLSAHDVPGLRMPSARELLAFVDPGLHRQRRGDSALREHAGDARVRMFEALEAGDADAIVAGPLPEASVQALRAYEAALKEAPPAAPGRGFGIAAAPGQGGDGRDNELRQLRERVVARDQENRMLRELVAKAEDGLARREALHEQDLVAKGELRARLERSDRDLNRTADRVAALQGKVAEALDRQRSLGAELAQRDRALGEIGAARRDLDARLSEMAANVARLDGELAASIARGVDLEAELGRLRGQVKDRDRRIADHAAARLELKDKLAARSSRVAELGAALTRTRGELDERFAELARVSALLFELEHQHRSALAARDSQLAEARRALADMRSSRAWRITRPLRTIGRQWQRSPGGSMAPIIAAVEGSGLFDRAWYLAQYPDVAASGLDPVEHYVGFGAAEGRDPGPGFSTAAYLSHNADVREAGLNPLAHFALHGRQEGRSAQ